MTALTANDIGREKIELWKRTYCKGATDDELMLFVETCKRTRLSPEARQIYAVKRWDSSVGCEVMSPQLSIDAFRLIAERTGKYAGQTGPFFYDEKNKAWVDFWLSDQPPPVSKVGVLRHDFKDPVWATAKFKSYAQKKKNGELTKFWHQMPELMLGKCAESLALRKAFPNELSGLYTIDEMQQACNETETLDAEIQEPKPALAASNGKNREPRIYRGTSEQQLAIKTRADKLGIDEMFFDEIHESLLNKELTPEFLDGTLKLFAQQSAAMNLQQ